jgi:MFS family permease
MVIAYIDRSNLSVALADKAFISEFALSSTDRGLMNSAFFWTYAFLQIPAGFLVDKFGVKFPYAIGFALWSLVSAATAGVTSIPQLVALRMALGVGEAVVTPASLRWIRFNVGEKQRGLAVGIYMAGTKFGPALGAPLAAFLINAYGWQRMFLILGLGCLVWLVPWMLLVKNDDRELEATHVLQNKGQSIPFGRLFTTRLIWGIVIGTFCYNYFVYFCMTWLPAYFAESRGLSLKDSGAYTGFSFGGMAVTAIVAGFVADRLITRGADPVRTRKMFTIAGLLVASTVVFGVFAESNQVALGISILSLSGLGLATANYWALTQTLMPGAAIGRIAGVQNMASNLSGIVAPLLTGWLLQATGSYKAPIYAVGAVLLTGVLAYVLMVHARYAPRAGA